MCITEIARTAQLSDEFAMRNVKVPAISIDPLDEHYNWIADISETQNTHVKFRVIAHENRTVAGLHDTIHPEASETFTVRSLFCIGPDKNVKLTIKCPASTDRNFFGNAARHPLVAAYRRAQRS